MMKKKSCPSKNSKYRIFFNTEVMKMLFDESTSFDRNNSFYFDRRSLALGNIQSIFELHMLELLKIKRLT